MLNCRNCRNEVINSRKKLYSSFQTKITTNRSSRPEVVGKLFRKKEVIRKLFGKI